MDINTLYVSYVFFISYLFGKIIMIGVVYAIHILSYLLIWKYKKNMKRNNLV